MSLPDILITASIDSITHKAGLSQSYLDVYEGKKNIVCTNWFYFLPLEFIVLDST